MRVKVVYYGFLKTLACSDGAEVEVGGSEPTVRDVLASVARRIGVSPEQMDSAAAAMADELVPRSTRVRDGDVVMLLPPVSGG